MRIKPFLSLFGILLSAICLPLAVNGQATIRFQWDSLWVIENQGNVQIPIELQNGQAGVTYTVSVATTLGGTASAGVDYQWTNTTHQLSTTDPVVWVPLALIADASIEPNEEIRFSLASISGGATISGPIPFRVLIQDASPCYLRFATPDSQWVENEGIINIPFLLSNANPYQSMQWAVQVENGTAYEGLDFELMLDTITLLPSTSTIDFKIMLLDNNVSQNTRWARLHLVPLGGAAAVAYPIVFTLYLEDDDYMPSASMSDTSLTYFEAIRWVPFRVALDVPPVQPLTVYWNTENGTAFAGVDYEAHSDSIVFQPGQTEAWDSVWIWNDIEPEGQEAFMVRLTSTGVGGQLAMPDRMFIILTDNDPVGISDQAFATLTNVEVYPNPFAEHITLRGLNSGSVQLRLWNTTGTRVAEYQLVASSDGVCQWQVPSVASGVYRLQVTQNGVDIQLPLVRVP